MYTRSKYRLFQYSSPFWHLSCSSSRCRSWRSSHFVLAQYGAWQFSHRCRHSYASVVSPPSPRHRESGTAGVHSYKYFLQCDLTCSSISCVPVTCILFRNTLLLSMLRNQLMLATVTVVDLSIVYAPVSRLTWHQNVDDQHAKDAT